MIYNEVELNHITEIAVILYSVNTTGKSKGVILSRFAINSSVDAIINYMQS